MRVLIFPAALLALHLTTACRKIDAGPNEGISYRDMLNRPIGQQDASDWTTDKDWKKVERELFNGLPVKVDGSGAGGYREVGFYGNPVEPAVRRASFFSYLRDTGPLHLKLVVVDKKYRKQVEQALEATPDSRGMFTLPLDLPADKYKEGELYRVYYVFYDDAQGLRYKGHGDFIVKEVHP